MKTGKACYVEIDSYAAAWLTNLVSRGVIAPGDVMCCSVTDIRPADLADYNQVHLYAGIGVHSFALRRAGIPDTANVWTFSEPCQPYSDAGKKLGFADERYLRPFTHHLVEQCRPSIVLGEQVASNDALRWLDVVQSDMERARYAGGAVDTCSAGFGAPHIRQRLRVAYVAEEWLADNLVQQRSHRLPGTCVETDARRWNEDSTTLAGLRDSHVLVDSERAGLERLGRHGERSETIQRSSLGHFHSNGTVCRSQPGPECSRSVGIGHNSLQWAGPVNGFWRDADWLYCRDGKWRPVEPGTFPLAHGASERVGRLRAYGNAIDAEATAAYYREVGEVLGLIA